MATDCGVEAGFWIEKGFCAEPGFSLGDCGWSRGVGFGERCVPGFSERGLSGLEAGGFCEALGSVLWFFGADGLGEFGFCGCGIFRLPGFSQSIYFHF